MGRRNNGKVEPTINTVTLGRQVSTRQESVTPNSNASSFEKIFHPFILAMKVFGVFIEKDNGGSNIVRLLHTGYCVSLSILIWMDAGRFMSIFVGSKEISGKFMGLCTNATFFILLGYTSSVTLYSMTKYLPTFIKELSRYQEDYGVCFDLEKFRRITKRILIGTLIISFIVNFGFFYLFYDTVQKSQTSLLTLNLTPFNTMASKYKMAFFAVFFALRYISIVMFYFSCIIYSELCYIFWKEYGHISNRLEEMITKNEENEIKINFEYYREQHQAVTRILKIGNDIMQQFPFIMYCFGIPLVCFTIYGVIKGTLELTDVMTLLNYLVFVVFGIIFVTAMGSKVNSTAHDPVNSIFHINMDSLPEKVLHQVNIFATRLTGPPIGIDVYGLFVIDRSTVLMLLGTIITYAVVVLQL